MRCLRELLGLGIGRLFDVVSSATAGTQEIVDSVATINGWPWSLPSLTYRDSLRDIVTALESRPRLLYQMGFRSRVARSTLADANETRDWRIYADWAQSLIRRARKLYAEEAFGVELDQTAISGSNLGGR